MKKLPKFSVFVTLFIDGGEKVTEQSLITTHCPTNPKILAEVAAYTRVRFVTGFEHGKYIVANRKAFVKVQTFNEVSAEDYQVLEKYMDVTYINKEQIDAWWTFKAAHS